MRQAGRVEFPAKPPFNTGPPPARISIDRYIGPALCIYCKADYSPELKLDANGVDYVAREEWDPADEEAAWKERKIGTLLHS